MASALVATRTVLMAANRRLQTLGEADLDALIAELQQQGSTELILLGPQVSVAANPDHWPDTWAQASVVYQLREVVPGLAQRLATLSKLTSLDLSGNRIDAAGAASLAALSQLTSLNLRGNGIGDAGAASLAALSQLTSLDLGENEIVDLKPLLALKNLRSLNLRNTKVQDLAPLRPFLEAGLQARWEEYGGDGINVYGCPLLHPSPEIVQQGQDAVLNYLREIEAQGEDHLYEAKVLILGEGSAGKTSLLRRLYQPALPLPTEEETTKGIDIHHHQFSGRQGQPFRLNVWDFGGQQIYHATHQFFLTKRSLYILLDDTRSNHRSVHDEGFKSWLELIETLSEASPVLIFQNEKADRSKSIDEAGIKGRFPNVMAVHAGNLEHSDAADSLAEAIRYHVQQLPHVGEAVPAQWLKIRQDIDKDKGMRSGVGTLPTELHA
jgi:hypothetical protein